VTVDSKPILEHCADRHGPPEKNVALTVNARLAGARTRQALALVHDQACLSIENMMSVMLPPPWSNANQKISKIIEFSMKLHLLTPDEARDVEHAVAFADVLKGWAKAALVAAFAGCAKV
jgi:hypothetical protein